MAAGIRMAEPVARIAALARALSHTLPLEEQLQQTVDCAAAILDARHASVRLFDVARTRLIATCRAGEPLRPGAAHPEFRVGEGLIGWIAGSAQPLRTGDAPADGRYVQKAEVTAFRSFIGVPLVSSNVCFGVISAVSQHVDAFSATQEELLSLLAGLCAPHLEMARLSRLAAIDPLTGVLNRRGLDLVLAEEAQRMASVAMCDLDRFKRVNDDHGHAAGDELLRRVAHLLASVVRGGDGVVRWGGEEFLLVLPGVELGQARRIVERARATVEEDAVVVGGKVLRVTISAGVAERHPGESRDAVIARADEALYVAKNSGRNRVELAA
jgi:diguanylate cyclase (GGDEF)-like protein